MRTEVLDILAGIKPGDAHAADTLFPLVYAELRRIAQRQVASERAGQTLTATALVHEAYLRLAGDAPGLEWRTKSHFFAAASQAMRRILIERARQRAGPKRGGGRRRVTLTDVTFWDDPNDPLDFIALDEALTELQRHDPQTGEIVMLRYFGGLSVEETALALDISARTVRRHWAYARAWLFDRMEGTGHDDHGPTAR